ncbi:MAG: DUF1819 family protein [Parasporobacterium sp.]|nr:DUF1819 family protein [Parasporobacterium sp.]
MDYSASSVKYSFWFVETRETARLLKDRTLDETRIYICEENIYQQKDQSRIINEFGCISRRLEAIPESLRDLLLRADIATAKLVVLISAMASDRLLFEFVNESFREKVRLGDEEFIDADLNIFFNNKAEQSAVIKDWTEGTVKKLKQKYKRFLIDAGLLKKENTKRILIEKPYIDPELRNVLITESMAGYLYALTGEM